MMRIGGYRFSLGSGIDLARTCRARRRSRGPGSRPFSSDPRVHATAMRLLTQGGLMGIANDVGVTKKQALRAYNKFNNDWTMNLSAMVAYNALTSFFPLALALVTLIAALPNMAGGKQAVAKQLNLILPSDIQSQINVSSLIAQVNDRSILLTIVSVIGLLWGGSNLFGSIESAFAIIFRVKTRDFVAQKAMSILMVIVFTVLVPASFVSTFLVSAATTTLGRILPGYMNGALAVIIGLCLSFAALFVLFSIIYTVVPNLPIRWRFAWRGALIAAATMTAVNIVFPTYAAHFLGTKQYGTAALATAIIAITWFWFFSVILLVGAQVNSLHMGIGYWRHDLTRTLMDQQIPTEGGAPTALLALRQARDSKVFDSPVGIVRDEP
jgi:membrane protein